MFQTKFAEGHAAEATILKIVESRGWELMGTEGLGEYGQVQLDGQVETELDVGVALIRCHPDGVATRTKAEAGEADPFQVGAVCGVEVKALAESTYEKWKVDGLDVISSYKWQAAIEMISLGKAVGLPFLPLVYAVGVKGDDGKVLADRVYLKFYSEPPVSMGQLVTRAAKIVQNARRLDEDGTEPECEQACYPCGFYTYTETACGIAYAESQAKKSGEGVRKYDGPEAKKLQTACLSWTRANEQEKKAKERKAEAGAVIAELTGGTCKVGRYKVVNSFADKGNVKWKGVAEALADKATPGEWEKLQEANRGAAAHTVAVEMLEEA
jgi:hypothetical protein